MPGYDPAVPAPLRHWLEDLFGRPILKFGAGPTVMVAGGIIAPLAIKVPLLIAGLLLVEGGQWAGQRALRREDAQHALTLLLRNTVDVVEASRPSPADRTLRANIMLPNEDGRLSIAYATAGYSHEEHRSSWEIGQGCAGVAWELERTQYAPEDEELPVSVGDAEARSRPWNMTDQQIRMTAGTIASVLSVPIRDQHDRVAGVFSLDDRKPITESGLADADVRAASEEVAVAIGVLLDKAEYTRPE